MEKGVETPAERAERHAHNARELHRMWRAAGAYAAPAVGFGVGAYLTMGGVRIALLVLAVLTGVVTLWVSLWALGAWLLVRAVRRRT